VEKEKKSEGRAVRFFSWSGEHIGRLLFWLGNAILTVLVWVLKKFWKIMALLAAWFAVVGVWITRFNEPEYYLLVVVVFALAHFALRQFEARQYAKSMKSYGKPIMIRRHSKRRPRYWINLILTAGFYLYWWRSNFLLLTDDSLIRHAGLLSRVSRSLQLDNITDIGANFGRIDSFFGTGRIEIQTAGTAGTEVLMNHIDDVEKFRQAIEDQRKVYM